MAKAKTLTAPQPDDFLYSFIVCTTMKCGWCGTRKSRGQTMWYENREKVTYCEDCRKFRLTEEGQAAVVIRRLSGILPGQYVKNGEPAK
jgi:hypothetical protein